MESSGKFSIGLSSLFTGNIDWQGCRLNNLFAMLQIAVFPQTLVEIVLYFLSQMLHLHVVCLVRAETTLPSTIVSKPLN